MACTHPRPAWRHPNNTLKDVDADTGVIENFTPGVPQGIRFKQTPGWDTIYVPCGKCEGCRADQAKMWAIRCYHEASLYNKNCFLTLTYDDDHLPPDGKIHKEHLQKFFRALRDRGHKIRYFACGEYGELTRRPHYHAIVFGEDFKDGHIEQIGRTTTATKYSTGEGTYVSPILRQCWVDASPPGPPTSRGYVQAAEINMATICYVCGYTAKKIGDPDVFTLMSRRPGIGHRWLDCFKDDLLKTNSVTIEGKEYAVPPRYLAWEPASLLSVKKYRQELAADNPRKTDLELDSKSKNLQSKRKQRREKI